MPKYINADELIKFLQTTRKNLPKDSKDFFTRDEMLLNFEQMINIMPTADVQEVKHGHWIKTEDFTMIEQYAVYEYECSKCGAHAHYGIDNYCYHCGAKMDGDKR